MISYEHTVGKSQTGGVPDLHNLGGRPVQQIDGLMAPSRRGQLLRAWDSQAITTINQRYTTLHYS